MKSESKYFLTFDYLKFYANRAAEQIKMDFSAIQPTLRIYGHPRGGIPAALAIVSQLNLTFYCDLVEEMEFCDIIIDDIYDTGTTYEHLALYNKPIYFLIDKRVDDIPEWVVFPWEEEFKERINGKNCGET